MIGFIESQQEAGYVQKPIGAKALSYGWGMCFFVGTGFSRDWFH
ncbi:hypothetical protein [Pseudoalteromonas porphyrae]|nr:hypothetical protein [Pseudoalteromonas porphyrae]